MVKYLLTGIDDDQWRLFKASCDIHGITIKEELLHHVDTVAVTFRKHPEYYQFGSLIKKKGGKKS